MDEKTFCLVKQGTNEIIACIPVHDGGKGIIHKDYELKIYDDTEPYFEDVNGKVILKDNTFGIKL